MFPTYYYFIQQAKNDSISISDVCAIAALLISIAIPIYNNFTAKRNAIKETFWMREVLIPQFSEILFTFIKESPGKFKSSGGLGSFYSNYALDVINSLRLSSLILGVSSEKLKTRIQNHIGDFENNMMAISDSDEYIDLLSKFSKNIVEEIQKAQIDT